MQETHTALVTLQDCLAALPSGFYWRGGICHLSAEVLIAPNYNDPAHRERLLIEYPQSLAHSTEVLQTSSERSTELR
jgi:hypothetical protein